MQHDIEQFGQEAPIVMNLYRIERPGQVGYDEYDSAAVAAISEEDAKQIHPCGSSDGHGWIFPEQVIVEFIGIAKEGTISGVIVASYNAG